MVTLNKNPYPLMGTNQTGRDKVIDNTSFVPQGMEIIERLRSVLDQFEYQPINVRTLKDIENCINLEFHELLLRRVLCLPVFGLRIVGAVPQIQPSSNTVNIVWKTDFYPSRRYFGQKGDVIPLGYHEEFDLYLGQQGELPPTLIARYGNNPSDYESFNPFLFADRLALIEGHQGQHFAEALQRAAMVDLDFALRLQDYG